MFSLKARGAVINGPRSDKGDASRYSNQNDPRKDLMNNRSARNGTPHVLRIRDVTNPAWTTTIPQQNLRSFDLSTQGYRLPFRG